MFKVLIQRKREYSSISVGHSMQQGERWRKLRKKNWAITNYLLGFAEEFAIYHSEGNGGQLKVCKQDRQVRLVL